jgi:hypothetical protein
MSESVQQGLSGTVAEFILVEIAIMRTPVVHSQVNEYLNISSGTVHEIFVTPLPGRV